MALITVAARVMIFYPVYSSSNSTNTASYLNPAEVLLFSQQQSFPVQQWHRHD